MQSESGENRAAVARLEVQTWHLTGEIENNHQTSGYWVSRRLCEPGTYGKRRNPLALLSAFVAATTTTVRGPGTAVAQWLRCCATNRKVGASIPAGVIGIFHRHKILPTQLLTEMSTRSISWG